MRQMTALLFASMFIPAVALADPQQPDTREVQKTPLVSFATPAPVFDLADAVRREAQRLARVPYAKRLPSGGSTPDRWKCRTRWAVLGAATGAAITAVAIRDGEDGFGPSRSTLTLLGALVGTAGGLLLSTEKC